MKKLLVLLALVAVIVGQVPKDPAEEEHKPGTPFEWGYNVDDSHSRKEESDGEVVKGEYRVLQDDGRTRVVRYTADWKNGVKVDISYEGEAHLTDEGNLSQGLRPSTTRAPPPPPPSRQPPPPPPSRPPPPPPPSRPPPPPPTNRPPPPPPTRPPPPPPTQPPPTYLPPNKNPTTTRPPPPKNGYSYPRP